VCLLDKLVSPTEQLSWSKCHLGYWFGTQMGRMNHVLDGGSDLSMATVLTVGHAPNHCSMHCIQYDELRLVCGSDASVHYQPQVPSPKYKCEFQQPWYFTHKKFLFQLLFNSWWINFNVMSTYFDWQPLPPYHTECPPLLARSIQSFWHNTKLTK